MKKKIYSDYKSWAVVYFVPVGLFTLGTIFQPGSFIVTLEIYLVGLLGALFLTMISRYSTYIAIDDDRVTLSVFFFRRNIKIHEIQNTKSIQYPIFGTSVESIDVLLKDDRRIGVFSFPYNKEIFQQIKELLGVKK
jgi:hypothetical protein